MAAASYVRRIALSGVVALITACGLPAPTPGPFSTLTGVVSDERAAPILGITVTIVGGAQDGATTTTDPTGRFTFFGAFAVGTSVTLRTSGAGFPETTTVVVPLARPGKLGSGEADIRESGIAPVVQIRGLVLDTFGQPVANALVEITGGAPPDVSAMSDSTGAFTMLGVFVNVLSVSVTKEGFTPLARAVQPSEFSGRMLLTLAAPDLVQLVSGAYAATFSVDSSCTALAPELRVHTYDAMLQPLSPENYSLTFSANAAVPGNGGLLLAVLGHTVKFDSQDDSAYAEALSSPLTFYEVGLDGGGAPTASVASPGLSTITFAIPFATIRTCQLAPGSPFRGCLDRNTVSQASCPGATLTLTRK